LAIAAIETISTKKLVVSFLVFNLVLRLVFLNINVAEYTDGILQLTMFRTPSALWPPLYTMCALLLSPLVGSLLTSGKLLSCLASTALIIPLFSLSTRVGGKRWAFYSCLLYSVAPIALRWSVRVMTDSLFVLLFIASVYFLFLAAMRLVHVDISLFAEQRKFREIDLLIGLSCLLSVLATLTRYQGFILLPLNIAAGILAIRRHRRFPAFSTLMFSLWGLVIWWIAVCGFGHVAQFEGRMGITLSATLLNYWNTFESFLILLPYFITYPVFGCVVIGLLWSDYQKVETRLLLGLLLYVGLLILILQTLFSSFQSRYLLPIVPLLLIFGGGGLAAIHEKMESAPRAFAVIVLAILTYSFVFALGVMVLQRGVFGDIKTAGEFLRTVPDSPPIYSNEIYNPKLTGNKLAFYSGKRIHYVGVVPLPDGTLALDRTLPPGAILCLHSAYGGRGVFQEIMLYVEKHYQLTELKRCYASIVPLLPDVMEEPLSHQNPTVLYCGLPGW
jgi:hypothetical protein